MVATQSANSTLVSHVATALVSIFGFGALTIQTGFYLLSLGTRETKVERATVSVLYLISLCQSVADVTGAIRFLSHHLVDNSPASQAKVFIEFTISPLLGVIMIGICHIFVANRILSFASSVQTSAAMLRRTLFWTVCAGVTLCCLLGISSIAVVWATLILLPQGRVTIASLKAFNIISSVYSFFCCGIDISLAVFVAWETRKAKSLANTSADHVLRSLLQITVSSAVITVLAQAFKSILVFINQVGWAGTAFSVATATYPITLLLSISLPRAKSTSLSQGHGPQSHDFFSPNKSHDFSSSLVPQTGSQSALKELRELEKQTYASLSRTSSRGDGAMGFAEMLEESEIEFGTGSTGLGVQILSSSSSPSSPIVGGGGGSGFSRPPSRPSSPSRMIAAASSGSGPRQRPMTAPQPLSSTYSPTFTYTASTPTYPPFPHSASTSPPTSSSPLPPTPYTVNLDSPPATQRPTISRQSSVVRPRRTATTDFFNPNAPPKSASFGDVPGTPTGGAEEGLDLQYIFSGLAVHSVTPLASRSKKNS